MLRAKHVVITGMSVVLFALFTGCSDSGDAQAPGPAAVQQSDPGGSSDLSKKPMEFQLACLNVLGHETAQPDQVKVRRFRYLLSSLAQRHKTSEKTIGDWTVKAQGVMSEKGIEEPLLDTMEALNSARIGEVSYEDSATMYAMVRCDGMSREDASKGLQQFIQGLHRLQGANK